MKRCSKCGIEKAASEFYKNKSRKDGLCSRCKACEKLYKEANKERQREYDKLYREANKERLSEQEKLYREANKERISEYKKLYRKANKERRREYAKLYREANKERISKRKKLYYEANKEQRKLYLDERYIAARMKNGYTREEAIILRGIYKAVKRGEQNRDTCDQLFMAGLL